MFVSKRRYLELQRDYEEVAKRGRELAQDVDFYQNVAGDAKAKLWAIKHYCNDRSELKNVSRPAVLNIVEYGTPKKPKKGSADVFVYDNSDRILAAIDRLETANPERTQVGEQLPLWD